MDLSGSEATLGGLPRARQSSEPGTEISQVEKDGRGNELQSASETDIEAQKDYDYRLASTSVRKRLTLTFKNLTVRGTSSDEALGETLWSRVDPTQLLDIFCSRKRRGNKVCPSPARSTTPLTSEPTQTILHDVSGQVKPGEMVSCPCSFLIHTLPNQRSS